MHVDLNALHLERYRAIIEREQVPALAAHEAMLIDLLKEKGRPLSAAEIATLPAMFDDWRSRNPEYMPAPAATLAMILKHCAYPALVALVDRIEVSMR